MPNGSPKTRKQKKQQIASSASTSNTKTPILTNVFSSVRQNAENNPECKKQDPIEDIPKALKEIMDNQYHIIDMISDIYSEVTQFRSFRNQTELQLTELSSNLSTISQQCSSNFKQIEVYNKKFETYNTEHEQSDSSTVDSGISNVLPTIIEQSSSAAKLNEEIKLILVKEKQEEELISSCEKIKLDIYLPWNEHLKLRKKAYWNYIKNAKKANLYTDWANNYPEFLPLKYRPKYISNEPLECKKSRIDTAKYAYKNDIAAMKNYSEVHQLRFRKIDDDMRLLISESCSTDNQLDKLTEFWGSETKSLEIISIKQWQRNEDFLRKKKHEEEKVGETNLTKSAKLSPKTQNNSNNRLTTNNKTGSQRNVNFSNFDIANYPIRNPAFTRYHSRFGEHYPPLWSDPQH